MAIVTDPGPAPATAENTDTPTPPRNRQELANHFRNRREAIEANQPETGETAAQPETEAQTEDTRPSSTTEPVEQTVWQRLGIDESALSPDDRAAIAQDAGNRSIQAMQKRIHEASDTINRERERIRQLETELQTAQSAEPTVEEVPVSSDNPFIALKTIDAVENKEREIRDSLHYGQMAISGLQHDDDPTDQEDGKGGYLTRGQVKDLMNTLHQDLTVNLPRQRRFVQRYDIAHAEFDRTFGRYKTGNPAFSQMYESVANNPDFSELKTATPAHELAWGLMAIGIQALKSRAGQKAQQQQAPPAPRETPPEVSESTAAAAETSAPVNGAEDSRSIRTRKSKQGLMEKGRVSRDELAEHFRYSRLGT